MKKLTVTIGIAAYKAENNIENILLSLLSQNEGIIKIERIIVHCDPSGDKTISKASKFRDKRILFIENKERMGFAHAVDKLMMLNKSDILIELNDDIFIKDDHLIEKLSTPFVYKSNIGLVTGNPQPLPAKNFLQKAIISSFRAYEKMRNNYRNGDNEFTCDGKILAFSRKLIQKISFPKDYSLAGNVDTYAYFSSLEAKLEYKNVKSAVVFFNTPSRVKEFIRWSIRNNSNYYSLLNQFGDVVENEFKKPVLLFFYSLFIEFLKNPLGSLFIFFLGIYIKYKARSVKVLAAGTWDVIDSTKETVKL